MADRVDQLVQLAREIASADPDFQVVKGPSDGDHKTAAYLRELRRRAAEVFGIDCGEQKICGSTNYAVDFYLEPEKTVVEVALGLPNPSSEFEKDILKAIIGKDYVPVERLVFISRAGGEKKCRQPGRTALKVWALTKHSLRIDVFDLGGIPRKRRRKRERASAQGRVV